MPPELSRNEEEPAGTGRRYGSFEGFVYGIGSIVKRLRDGTRLPVQLVYKKSDESDRKTNSELAKNGEMSVNRPPKEKIANLQNLRVLSLYQPDSKYRENEGGEFGYHRTLNYYLDGLLKKKASYSSFSIFFKGESGKLVPKKVENSSGRVFLDGEEIFPHQYEGRWRFPEPLLEDAVAYSITEEDVNYMGIRPTRNNQELRKHIAGVKGDDEDVTMLQYRGHNGYGSGANIPEDILDPAVVFLGGCKSGRFLKKAQKHHFRSGIVSLHHSTGWEINHHRTRSIMKALSELKKQNRGVVTWRQLSDYLRKNVDRSERFSSSRMILPGDLVEA